MEFILLTQYSGKILGPIAKYLLGPILNGIFVFLNWLPGENSANVGVAIILFTFVIYILLLPLTIKQQKFSKLQAKMQPEIHAIQEKYKNKKDQNSQMAMQQETQAVYQKYGVSPTGSCVQLIIQMPILFALYRVIYSIPAYVGMIRNAFDGLVNKLYVTDGAFEFIQSLNSAATFKKQFEGITDEVAVKNLFVDVLNKATNAEWLSISAKFPELSSSVDSTMAKINAYNNFLGINVGYSPSETIKHAITNHSYFIVIIAVLIPILSAVTQWINVKLTPQASNSSTGNDQADQMASSMKAMNTFMPIFSAVMCFTLPAGLGIYWIAGSVVRSVEQVLINKHIDKMDIEAEIKKNVEKREARLKKAGIDPNKLTQNASLSTKAMKNTTTPVVNNKNINNSKSNSADTSATVSNNSNVNKPGSIAAKANLVKQYNEKNNK